MSKYYNINNRIKSPKLRVIDENNENLGIIDTQKALKLSLDKNLDLVVVAEKAQPPVARFLDFKKYLYDQKQKLAKGKSKKGSELKEFRLSPRIKEGEIKFKARRAKNFITKDRSRVKFNVVFKGREIARPEFGIDKLKFVVSELSEVAEVIEDISRKGRVISVTLGPKK